jgi:hypothetical protein
MLDGGPGNLTSLTSYYADTDFYSTCLTANPDGNLNITTYGNGSGQLGQWTFSGYDTTVPGDILAQEGNDLAVQVFNPTSSGGVTYVVQNRQVDIGNDRTTQFEVAPANIILSTDFSGNRYQWFFDNTGNVVLPDTVNPSINYANGQPYGGSGGGNADIGNWVFDGNDATVNNSGYPRLFGGPNGGPEFTYLEEAGNNASYSQTMYINNEEGFFVSLDYGNAQFQFATNGNTYLPGNIITGGATGNITGANVVNANTIAGNGNLYLQPDPVGNSGAYLDIYVTYGPDVHIAGNGENVIVGRDAGANVMVGADGNVTIQADSGTPHTWTFGNDGNLYVPQGGYIGAAGVKGDGTMLTGGAGNIASLTSFYANGFYSGCFTANPDGTTNITTYTGNGIAGQWTFGADGNLTLPQTTGLSSAIVTTVAGSNNSITIHPDGTGQLFIRGDNNELLTVYSDTVDQPILAVVKSFGNSLGSAGGGTFVGSYLRPGQRMQACDRLAALTGKGSEDSINYGTIPVGRIQIIVDENWTANSYPTHISFLNTPSGSTSQVENMRISPNGNVTIYNGNVISKGAYITGYDGQGTDAIYVGIPTFTPLGSNVVAQFAGNVNSYAQINFQNISTGNLASSDYILTADNGTDSTYFVDLGIAGSNHANPDFFGDTSTANDAYLYVVGSDQAGPGGGTGNLILGSSNGTIKLFVGNTAQANVIQTVSSTGISVVGGVAADSFSTAGAGGDIAMSGGDVTGARRVITTPTALANLTAVAGGRAFVNNGNLVAAGNFGAQIGSGGSNVVPVWSDGTNWYIG